MASQRARDIASGGKLTVERDNDKNPVVALREVAELTVNIPNLRNALISGLQRHVDVDEPEAEEMDAFSSDRDIVFENIEADEEALKDDLSITDDDAADFDGTETDLDS